MMKTLSTLALLCVCFLGVWCIDGPWPKGPVWERIRQRRQISTEEQAFLDAHNNKRRIVSPTAANMREMKWSDELATVARNHAQKCVFGHNGQRSSQSQTFDYVGENIYIGYGNANQVVTAWDDEKMDYDFSANSCSGICGHYTQVVWHASEYLGCARVQCGTNNYLSVCNYGPGGNFNNQRPYTSGNPCSQCPSGYTCNNNLCSKSSTTTNPCNPNPCQNGGTCSQSSTGNAVCTCAQGWTGSLCQTQVTSNPCNPNPCQNGGTCSQSSSGSAVCACTQGWTGSFCQTQVSGGTLLHECDFESNFCLGQDTSDTANFFRTQNYFGIVAPQGSYFAAVASSSSSRPYAFLVSMNYLPEADVRVEFDYTTYGTGRIYFSYGQGQNVQFTNLFTSSGENRIWKSKSFTIPAGQLTFYYFTGVVGGSGFGVVAIDNVRVTRL